MKRSKLIPGLQALSFALSHPRETAIILRVKKAKLTYLSFSALFDLARTIKTIEASNLKGQIIEAGCALGGSAIVITSNKMVGRQFRVYDTFEKIPPPSINDGADSIQRYSEIESGSSTGISGEIYYGYRENLKGLVTSNFSAFGYPINNNNVDLIKGLFENSMSVKDPVVLAHIDCDWYESVKTCLTRIAPRMVIGGRFIIDDYGDWSGCKKAVDEFLRDNSSQYKIENHARLHLIKIE